MLRLRRRHSINVIDEEREDGVGGFFCFLHFFFSKGKRIVKLETYLDAIINRVDLSYSHMLGSEKIRGHRLGQVGDVSGISRT